MFFDTPVSRSWIHSLNTATFTRDTTIRNCGPAVREKKRHRQRERHREKDREREVEREETVSKVHILECLAELPPTYLIELISCTVLIFFQIPTKYQSGLSVAISQAHGALGLTLNVITINNS